MRLLSIELPAPGDKRIAPGQGQQWSGAGSNRRPSAFQENVRVHASPPQGPEQASPGNEALPRPGPTARVHNCC